MTAREVTATQVARWLGPWRERPRGSAYQALHASIEQLLLDGRLPAGTRLPAERELARVIGVSRTTVTAAYTLLRDRGFASARQGSGTRTQLPHSIPRSSAAQPSDTFVPSSREDILDLACAALPAPAGLAQAVSAATHDHSAHLSGNGYDHLGQPLLRELIADRYTARGMPTTPDDILVTGGAVQALALVLRTVTEPGERVLVEHPTYPNALEAISRAFTRTVPVSLASADTGSAWDVESVIATVYQSAPRLAYLIPDFHNPTGQLMDDEHRVAVASALTRAHTLTVVDETMVDLGLDVDPADQPPPFAAYDASGRTILLGSMSKSHWGGLRIGWVRAPRELMPALAAARASLDLGTPLLSQLTAAHLLAAGPGVVHEQRDRLRARRQGLVAALQHHLPQWRYRVPTGGLSLWCELERPVSTALATAAAQRGVRLAAGPRFGANGTLERFVRLPFTLPEDQLADAVQRVATAYAAVTQVSSTARVAGVETGIVT